MRPDPKLAGLLGLGADAGPEQRAICGSTRRAGRAPASPARRCSSTARPTAGRSPARATVATLYATPRAPTANPAVTLRSVGSAGGQAAAFTYDLARSVVYTRQGNPAWAGQERDDALDARSARTTSSSAERPADWVDLDKVAIPQADEQQRLLANLSRR